MIPRTALALPILAGSLVLLLAVEWLLPGRGAPSLRHPPIFPSAAAGRSNDANIQWANTILARPVLSQSRRPAPAPDMASVSDTLPRLSAIIVIGGTRHAIFAALGQKPQLIAEGGEIGAYRIKTVAPDSVDLLGPNGLLTLKPQFASPAPAAPPPPSQ